MTTNSGSQAVTANAVPVRVLYVTPGGIEGRGGMGRMARYLDAAYRQAGTIECRFIDPYGPGPFLLMPLYFANACLQVTVACLLRRVDVIHLHMSHGGSALRKLLLLRLANSLGVATILHIHGSKFQLFVDRLRGVTRTIFLSSLRRADRIVVIGTFWQRYLVDGLGFPSKQIAVARNGVPLPAPIQRAATEAGPCRIVALGLLGPRKGTSDLLSALASPACREQNWHATIAGNGPVESYHAEALAQGLGDRVTFPGWVDATQAQELLSAADIFVLPSYNEGLPVAILEAMASGLPVITTPVGAIPDLVLQDDTGILCPPGAIPELSEALASLIGDPARRRRLGANGRRRIEEQFTIEATALQLTTLYKEVVGRRD